MTLEQTLQAAVTHHQAGQLAEAEALYRQVLSVQPQHPDALHLLGVIANQTGQPDAAVGLISRAIAEESREAVFHSNLGEAYRALGRFAEAIACYHKALTIDPGLADAHNNLGIVLYELGRWHEAVVSYQNALAISPSYPEVHNNLGNAFSSLHRLEEAVTSYERALAARPDFAAAHNNRGNALKDMGRIEEAIAAYERALALKPDHYEAHYNRGNTLKDQGRTDEAIACYQKALELHPGFAEAHSNIGVACKDLGQVKEAVNAFRRAVALAPENTLFHSNLLFALHLHSDYKARALWKEHQQWAQRHEQPRQQFQRPHTNTPKPQRRLKIGYVSPDMREHPVGRILLPVLQHHNRKHFEITCYADVAKPDALTEGLRDCADRWRETIGLSEERLAQQIQEDGIDILVDLALHTAGNQLPVFARKPAPVQVTWLGYCSTTGLEAMDYRLTDPYQEPPADGDEYYSETSITLPDTFWCYPAPENAPDVSALPALTAGHVTFGCLNNFHKINDPALKVWAKLLRSVPNARLVLHTGEGSHRDRARQVLADEGVDPDCVRFVGKVSLTDYFASHGQTDIALDTFPYPGGTTTCDALWMGVPVVSLAGRTAVSRGGLSILSNAGLPELAAHTEEEYVRIAVELASDLPRLTELRATLRARMQASPLMDAPRFTKNLEAAYRAIWKTWCQSRMEDKAQS